jgi:hypothetical protein
VFPAFHDFGYPQVHLCEYQNFWIRAFWKFWLLGFSLTRWLASLSLGLLRHFLLLSDFLSWRECLANW